MEYLPVFILLLVGAIIAFAGMGVSYLMGPKVFHPQKDQPFECGVPPVGGANHRISVRFYLVAILFLLFDVEVVFFVPWAIAFKKHLLLSPAILWSMAVFFLLLLVGLFYEWRKGALEWE